MKQFYPHTPFLPLTTNAIFQPSRRILLKEYTFFFPFPPSPIFNDLLEPFHPLPSPFKPINSRFWWFEANRSCSKNLLPQFLIAFL